MKKILWTAALSLAVIATWAQAPHAGKVPVTTCWYNANRELTGTEAAPPGTQIGTTAQAAESGEHTYSYTVAGSGPTACPAKLPVSTEVSQ